MRKSGPHSRVEQLPIAGEPAPPPSPNRSIPVFAYGSNMHLRDVARWMAERDLGAPYVERVEPAVLPDYRLAWCYRSPARGAGAANVLPAEGAELPGLVLFVDEPTFEALDRKEHHPTRYDRGEEKMTLRSLDGRSLRAWVYRVTDPWMCPEPTWPRTRYLRLLVESAREHRLPQWHLDTLLRTPTVHPHVGIVVRPAQPSDAYELAEIHVRTLKHVYRDHRAEDFIDALSFESQPASWRRSLLEPKAGTHTWVAERDGGIVALATAGPCRDENAAADAKEIYAMCVRPREHGRGVGRALMKRVSWLLEGCETTLWVLAANERARRFYERAGFRADGAEWNKHVGGRTLQAIRMRRPATGFALNDS